MRAVIQRVTQARVVIDGRVAGEIEQGFMVLLGITVRDTEKEARYLCDKIAALRIFEDENDKMNLSLADVGGGVLLVSQFTLCANSKKGNRPSFIDAARPEQAIPLYELALEHLRHSGVAKVASGEFGAYMQVELVNDGPVTIILDTDEIMPK